MTTSQSSRDSDAQRPVDGVVADRRGHVAVLTINRPETRNALSTDVLEGLVAALDWAESETAVRVGVLTGGTKLFASGADVRELRAMSPAAYLLSKRQTAFSRIAAFRKPLIAAVAGFVLGSGCELAMSCDLIVAGDSAVFGQPEIQLGIIPGAGGTQRWPRSVGRLRAAGVVLAGGRVDAWAAHRMGVVHKVVPAECVVEAGVQLAEEVARFSPLASRLGKSALRAAEEVGIGAGLEFERSQLAVLMSSEDHLEGIDAFLEKRSPRFTGR